MLPKDALTSAGAHERWLRWKADLKKLGEEHDDGTWPLSDMLGKKSEGREGQKQREAQLRLLAACWNESQPYSPASTPSGCSDPADILCQAPPAEMQTLSPQPTFEKSEISLNSPLSCQTKSQTSSGTKHVSWPHSKHNNDGQGCTSFGDDGENNDEESSLIDDSPELGSFVRRLPMHHQTASDINLDLHELSADGGHFPSALATNPGTTYSEPPRESPRVDEITDTVGAIAIDCLGNIAAASSSGGIGMKHKGRVGPAALVGIGTAVIPIDPEDPLKTSSATVTSGTGEHMATTMAAMTCASRIYNSERKGKDGLLENTDCDSAMHEFLQKDFMGKLST